jgi:uncharacterized membrane protein
LGCRTQKTRTTITKPWLGRACADEETATNLVNVVGFQMKTTNWKPRFLIYVLALQVAVILAIVVNIPFVRQVLVPLYLILVPGFALLKALRIETSNVAETVLFSVGLSIASVMLIGLLINESGFIPQPLSTTPLLIVTSIFVLLVSALSCLKEKGNLRLSFPDLKISLLAPYIALPLLSVIGMLLVKAFDNNLLVVSTIIIISVLLALALFSKLPTSHYPFALVSIASALLLMTFLTSNYINGYDVPWEYMVFTATKNASYWNPSFGLTSSLSWVYIYVSNSMLISTVFPTVVSNMANIDGTWIFNIIFPLIFSLVPLALYQFFQTQWGKKVAFFSALFFISNSVFFYFRDNTRQMAAELFFLLIFLVLFKKNINIRSRWILFACFSFALIVSYYSLTYVFIFLIFSTWLFAKAFSKDKNRRISSAVILFFSVLTFLWYVYVSAGPFNRLTLFLNYTIQSIAEFFVVQSRGSMVLSATGVIAAPTFLHQIGRILFYISALFILIGFVTLIVRRKKESIDSEYSILTILSMFILSLAIILPNFASDFQTDKLYEIALLFLSPLFIIGGMTFFKNALRLFSLKKEKREAYGLILIATVLIPFFLFQTGFVYEVARDPVPSSIALSGYRMDDLTLLSSNLYNENDFFGATWLSQYTSMSDRTIYADIPSMANGLFVALMDINFSTQILSNETAILKSPSYIFLTHYDTKYGIIIEHLNPNVIYNITELSILNATNAHNDKIYTNGACEIHYYSVP